MYLISFIAHRLHRPSSLSSKNKPMRGKILAAILLLALLVLVSPGALHAQQTSPSDAITLFLAKQGYAVLAVGNLPDANGAPVPTAVYVLMNAASSNLDSQDTALQALWGFAAIRKHLPEATTLVSILRDRHFLVMFVTDAAAFDKFLTQQVPPQEYWNGVRRNVRIVDTRTNMLVSEKDFSGGSHTTKPFTEPSFTPQQAACPAAPGEALLIIQNNYIGFTMRFTIGGGAWGTHDYDVPGDGQRYKINMPPGTYTYTASIAGKGTAHGEPFEYKAGNCYPLTFSP